jgi:hypothetical protein
VYNETRKIVRFVTLCCLVTNVPSALREGKGSMPFILTGAYSKRPCRTGGSERVVVALCYKTEGRGFEFRCHWTYKLT